MLVSVPTAHQWHVFVFLAAATWLQGMMEYFQWRQQKDRCDTAAM